MKVLLLHNHYGSHSGESTVLEVHASLLKAHGHDVLSYTRSSIELDAMRFGKAHAFFSSLYNPASIRKVLAVAATFRPDFIHIHNMYPLLSPSVLPAVRRTGVPVVMTVHNYRLVCPNGLFYNNSGICERCTGGREWQCVQCNCEASLPKSIGYALRNAWARIVGYYTDNVDAFLCLTEFQKRKLLENGFPSEKCHVLPNFIDTGSDNLQNACHKVVGRKGFFFIGRLNRQKGVDIIVEAAKLCPGIPFFLAGAPDPAFIDTGSLPPNVKWLGVLDEFEKIQAFRSAMALVFASRSYEGFPMVFLEAMQQSLPVIAPNLAGYPEIIQEGINGWLFKSEDVADLVEKIRYVKENQLLAQKLGDNGRDIAKRKYSPDFWYYKYVDIIKSLY